MAKYLLILLIIFFLGCNNSNENIDIPEIPEYVSEPLNDTYHNISIHGFSGPYPETYKDKKLGDGLLNRFYKKIDNFIMDNLKYNEKIKIKFVANTYNSTTNNIINGITQYFQNNNNYLTVFDGVEDVLVKIIYKNDFVNFKVVLKNSDLFRPTPPIFIKVPESLRNLEKEAYSFWSDIEIKGNNGQIFKFKVMKRPVLISEYNPNILTTTKKAITYISFDDADAYCYKKYRGSVVSLYVFEYALRKGAIIPSTRYGASKEFVAGFDPANSIDISLKRPGDIVYVSNNKCESLKGENKIDCYASEDASTQLIFNYDNYRYENVDINYKGSDVTFRCMKRSN